MTIGEALKYDRITLGLTQTQMAAGLMSESFYSKVERGVHSIDADLLIKLLHKHGISAQSFFYLIDRNDKELFLEDSQRLVIASNKRDLKEVDKIIQELKDKNAPKWIQTNAAKIRTWMTSSNEGIIQEEKDKVKKRYLLADKWSIALINALQLNIYVLDFEDLYQIINIAYKKFEKATNQDELSELYMEINAVAFLARCYHESDKKHAQSSLDFLHSTRLIPSSFYGRIFAAYYEALFDHDKKKIDAIAEALKESGLSYAIQDTLER